MSYKCTPQLKGLVRGEPKNSRHRANGKWICAEAGKERVSRSETLDRTRSPLNQYGGITNSGFELWDKLEEEADSYEAPVTMKSGKKVTRKLRSDAVIGYAVIVNPPDEMCEGWDAGTYKKFYNDSMSVLSKIEPRLFRPDNIRMTAKHRDEGLCREDGSYGEHAHFIGVPKDKEGRYCGNLIDKKLLGEINRRYPAMMRAKGWDLEDLDVTDWKRYNEDKAYKAERQAKYREHGLSVNDYVAKQNRKNQKRIDAKQAEQDHREEELEARERALQEQAEEQARRNASLNAREAQMDALEGKVEELTGTLDKAVQSVTRHYDMLKNNPSSSPYFKKAYELLSASAKKVQAQQRTKFDEAMSSYESLREGWGSGESQEDRDYGG